VLDPGNWLDLSRRVRTNTGRETGYRVDGGYVSGTQLRPAPGCERGLLRRCCYGCGITAMLAKSALWHAVRGGANRSMFATIASTGRDSPNGARTAVDNRSAACARVATVGDMTLRPSPLTARLASISAAVLLGTAGTLGALGLTSCSNDDERPGRLPTETTPGRVGTSPAHTTPSATPSLTDEQQIIAQYRRFWLQALPAGAAAAPARRRAIFAPVVTEPELGVLMNNFAYFDGRGEKAYGVNTPLRQSVVMSGSTALVTGCLDSHNAGRLNAGSRKKLTKGVDRNPVRANLKKGADSIWRVSTVIFTGGTEC
jgi:hypothetical protein